MQVTRNIHVEVELPTDARTVLAALSEFGDPTAEDSPAFSLTVKAGVLHLDSPPKVRKARGPRKPKAEAAAKPKASAAA